jgi:hypothetical protein
VSPVSSKQPTFPRRGRGALAQRGAHIRSTGAGAATRATAPARAPEAPVQGLLNAATASTGARCTGARAAARATASTGARGASARNVERSHCQHGLVPPVSNPHFQEGLSPSAGRTSNVSSWRHAPRGCCCPPRVPLVLSREKPHYTFGSLPLGSLADHGTFYKRLWALG